MKNNVTELVFILDRSGSMHGLEADCVGGFNAFIEKQRDVEGACYVTTVLFANDSETVHDRAALGEVKPMTRRDFTVGGCTALLDAIGEAVRHIETIHRYARREDVPEHTTFIIMTDGLENASQKYSSAEVKRLIERKKREGWEFLFLAANIDAVETAARFGIARDRAVDYRADGRGTRVAYESVAEAVANQRMGGKIAEDWMKPVQEDFEARK